MKNRKNVALGKPVNGVGSNVGAVTDGIAVREIHWDGGVAPAYVTVDLKGYYRISGINLVTYYDGKRSYRFSVSVSADRKTFETVAVQSDDVTATEKGYSLSFAPVTARFVRITMTHNTANSSVHIAELAVYGEEDLDFIPPAKDESDKDAEDIAFGKPTHAGENDAFSSFAVDGSLATRWIGHRYPCHLDVDLEENYLLDQVTVLGDCDHDETYRLYISLDGVHFDFVSEGKMLVSNKSEHTLKFRTAVAARVVRVLVTSTSAGAGGCAILTSVKVHGKKAEEMPVIPTRRHIEFDTHDQWLEKNYGVNTALLKDENGLYDVKKTYTTADTVDALLSLVERTVGKEHIHWFNFCIDDRKDGDYYILSEANGRIRITANCGVSAAMGLNHYLKYFCNVQITQQTKQVKMPESMPHIAEAICRRSPYEVRYAYNYCTLSYTMPFFGYEQWQRELDFLMLSGVNLILDLTATEALWVSYLQKLGYNTDQAKDYVCGYCYKAWWLMGNLEGYGGPVADSWVVDTLEMARRNQRYMTVMGAQPALQTFVGAMPETFGTIVKQHLLDKGFTDVSAFMAPQGLWAGGHVRPNVLKTTYDGYSYLAKLFYDTQNEIYGQVSDYYCGDVCHEGGIIPKDLSKPEMSATILKQLLDSDPNAVWMLQGWWSNPVKEVLDGFGKYRKDHIIILDLASLANPKWNDTKTWDGIEFGGTGWIFCILDNYGGKTGMHGRLKQMMERIVHANRNSTLMKGIGITPEGTFQNPIVFELFWEMGWRDQLFDIDAWVASYIRRRYGVENSELRRAWKILARTLYGKESYDGTGKNNIINENASLALKYCVGPYYHIPYDRATFEKAVTIFMENGKELCQNEGFVYDAQDLMRMLLTIASDDYFEIMKRAFALSDAAILEAYGNAFLDTMRLISHCATFNRDELLGNWIGRAYDWMTDSRTGKYDDFDRDMMEYNARILLTVWASSPISNYANRLYNGLIEDYCIRMWEELLTKAVDAINKGETIPASLGDRCFTIGWEFATNGKTYSRTVEDPMDPAAGLYATWSKVKGHMLTPEIPTTIAQLDIRLAEQQVKEKEETLTAAIATNIEH